MTTWSGACREPPTAPPTLGPAAAGPPSVGVVPLGTGTPPHAAASTATTGHIHQLTRREPPRWRTAHSVCSERSHQRPLSLTGRLLDPHRGLAGPRIASARTAAARKATRPEEARSASAVETVPENLGARSCARRDDRTRSATHDLGTTPRHRPRDRGVHRGRCADHRQHHRHLISGPKPSVSDWSNSWPPCT